MKELGPIAPRGAAKPAAFGLGTQAGAALEFALLAAALACGAVLRFWGLSAREMSADEAASWAAAAAPSASEVIRLQARLNPGKLPLHDLALHSWIAFFGDGIFAMRALSALFGVGAVALVYLVAKELLRGADSPRGSSKAEQEAFAPAITALLYALSLIAIKYAREARMYSLVLAAELLQVALFIRVARSSKPVPWVALALLTTLSLAANFSAAFLLGAEAVYLLLIFCRRRARSGDPGAATAPWAALALATGVAVFLPLSFMSFAGLADAARVGTWQWIERPPLYAPLSFFNKATGTFAFPILAFAAALGALKSGRWRRDEVQFLLVWMWAPVLFMFGFSMLIRPVFVERLALISFVPFFILTAMGIAAIESRPARFTTASLCVALTLGHVCTYSLKPHDAQWREAAALAMSSAPPAGTVAVAPAYAVDVVRYYKAAAAGAREAPGPRLMPASRANLAGADTGGSAVLILGEQGVAASQRARLTASFPRLLSRLRGVEVRLAR